MQMGNESEKETENGGRQNKNCIRECEKSQPPTGRSRETLKLKPETKWCSLEDVDRRRREQVVIGQRK